jgi:SAM-dependent methyltransferase
MSAPVTAIAAVDLYGEGLRRTIDEGSRPSLLRAVTACGERLPLPLDRYVGPVLPDDEGVLAHATGPVLDVGCGPGRHVLELRQRGIFAVGVDISPVAVRVARRRGAAVIEASIFDDLPGAGKWGSALLLDGNIGIGGRPTKLLARIAALLNPDGDVLVEVDPPGIHAKRLRVRLESPEAVSPWFPWARLGMSDLDYVALSAGFRVAHRWCAGERWFAQLKTAELPS